MYTKNKILISHFKFEIQYLLNTLTNLIKSNKSISFLLQRVIVCDFRKYYLKYVSQVKFLGILKFFKNFYLKKFCID